MIMDMAFFMDTHFYAGMSGSVEEMWRFFYEPPPTIVPNSTYSSDAISKYGSQDVCPALQGGD